MFRCPYSYSRSDSVLTLLLHPDGSPSLHPSLFPPPLPLCALHPHLTLLSSLPVSFPHSSLAWVPRQMVRASRCSPTQPLEMGKTKPGSKANKSCWRETSREVHGTIDLWFDRGRAFHRQVGRKHTGGHKKEIDQSQRPILMLWNTLDFTDVGTPLRQSDVPDTTVNNLSIEWSEYKSTQVPKIWFLLISLSLKDLAKSSKTRLDKDTIK